MCKHFCRGALAQSCDGWFSVRVVEQGVREQSSGSSKPGLRRQEYITLNNTSSICIVSEVVVEVWVSEPLEARARGVNHLSSFPDMTRDVRSDFKTSPPPPSTLLLPLSWLLERTSCHLKSRLDQYPTARGNHFPLGVTLGEESSALARYLLQRCLRRV